MPNATLRADAQAMPNRRAALGALAAAAGALLAVPDAIAGENIATPVDPVFAAIECHKAAAAAFNAFCGKFDEIEDPTDADENACAAHDDAERNAMFALADTTPTTHAGAYAALRYLVKEARERHYSILGIFGDSLIKAKWGTFRPAHEATHA